MKKSLAECASIAEILGAIAIVISLVFVGLEIRDNTKATQAATFQDHMGYEIAFVTHVGSDPELARIWETAQQDFARLSGAERTQGTYLMLGAMRLWEGFYLQWRSGTLSEEGWRAREPLVRSFARLPMPQFGGASPDNQVFSGPFMEYILEVRAEAAQ